MEVLKKMNIIGTFGCKAAVTDRPTLHASIARHSFCAGPADYGQTGLGDRFP
jgi:hypothetical protein